jgi:uncharacterized membrane protein
MNKDLKDYLDGQSGNPLAPGWGQVGYAQREAAQRRQREADERAHAERLRRSDTQPYGGLVFALLVIIILASGAQLAGVDLYGVATQSGWLTRYADLPAWAVLAGASAACLIVSRNARLWDLVLIIALVAMLALDFAGHLPFRWQDAVALIR